MNKSSAVVLCGLVASGSAWAYQRGAVRSHYADESVGYSLDTPKFPAPGERQVVLAVFSGQPEAGFGSNMTVINQAVSTTRKAYRDVTLASFQKLGLKVNEDRDVTVSGRDAIRLDYEGKTNARDLRFLSLAVIEKDRVLLFTCTATVDAFPKIAAEFRSSLDSVRLREGPRP